MANETLKNIKVKGNVHLIETTLDECDVTNVTLEVLRIEV
jgi:hypothetical protein